MLQQQQQQQQQQGDDQHTTSGAPNNIDPTAYNLRRPASEQDLEVDFVSMKAGISKDRMTAAAQQAAAAKKAKSPFNLFKKPKHDGPYGPHDYTNGHPMPMQITASSSEYSVDSDIESVGVSVRLRKKRDSQTSYSSDNVDAEATYRELEMNMDLIDEYYYGVRIFPGQDPSQVYVGWVTPHFCRHTNAFDIKNIRNVVICNLDQEHQVKSSVSRKNCYIVSAGDLQTRYNSQSEDSTKRMQPGLLIGCHVDVSSGIISFTVNGQEAANKFQVDPGAMLFPAVFFEPTNKEVLQVELGHTKTALPLSSILFRGGKHVHPQCPPRLDLQYLRNHQWARCPMHSNQVHVLKLSEVKGWSMLCEDPVQMLALHVPEEDKCLDIMELKEHKELLRFHKHTLVLYHALCSHGNHKAAHELTKHVDERQFMFIIKSKYMPGELRMGFHNLLISLHLDAHAKLRLMTQNEFIVPLLFKTGDFQLFKSNCSSPIYESIPSLEQSVSVRPQIVIDDRADSTKEPNRGTSPYFPLDLLKHIMMDLLTETVEKGAAYIRDPIGGSNETQFVPLLKVIDKLLLIGLFNDKDLKQLLYLIDARNFDTDRKIEGSNIQKNNIYVATNEKHGLIQIKLSEAVKLELCTLLEHLCDTQLRHRVEALIAFSESFVGKCQAEQKRRYIDIKQSDMPMVIAAKRTREFRCPPQEQMRTLLRFKVEDENSDIIQSPIGEDLKDLLKKFNQDLLKHANHHPPEDPILEGETVSGISKKKKVPTATLR